MKNWCEFGSHQFFYFYFSGFLFQCTGIARKETLYFVGTYPSELKYEIQKDALKGHKRVPCCLFRDGEVLLHV